MSPFKEEEEKDEDVSPEEQERQFRAACERAEEQMRLIEEDIAQRRFRKCAIAHKGEGWGGAGVIVSTKRRWRHLSHDYPRWVRTPHAGEAAWMIGRMQGAFGPLVSWGNKLGFYGGMGNAIECYQEELAGKPETVEGVLGAMLQAGREMLAEMREGCFDARPWDRRKSKEWSPPAVCLSLVRRLARHAWDDPKVTLFGVMPIIGPGECTRIDIYADQPCWRALLDEKPAILDIATEVCVCDTERGVLWKDGQKKDVPKEATGRDETLIQVVLPFASQALFNAVAKDVMSYLVPPRMSMKFFSECAHHREPVETMDIILDGREVGIEKLMTEPRRNGEGEAPLLYERGLPVRPIDLPFHVNVLAELPDPVPDALVAELVRSLKART